MQAVKPHILVVELCVDRASVMQMDEEAILKESRDFSLGECPLFTLLVDIQS